MIEKGEWKNLQTLPTYRALIEYGKGQIQTEQDEMGEMEDEKKILKANVRIKAQKELLTSFEVFLMERTK